jgi:hypothetical protein
MSCYRHPEAAEVATCIAYKEPICAECREEVAGHPMCAPCVAAAQERLAASPAPAEPVASAVADPSGAASSYADGIVSLPPLAPLAPSGAAQYGKAILFAMIAAVISAVVWDKIVLWTGFQLGIVAIAVGWLVGTALCMGAEGRPGKALPVLGALLAGFAIILGRALLISDMLPKEAPDLAKQLSAVPFLLQLPFLGYVAVRSLDFMDWIFVAIGVWEGWSIPNRMNREAEYAASMPAQPAATATAGQEPPP